jgi:glycosyltransferase involved in cell wall biosynthesis
MGSRFIETSFREFGLLRPDDAVHVLPYGVDRAPTPPRPARPDEPLRVGFVGSLLPHKGAHVAISAFSSIPARTACLEVWGDESASPAYSAELRALAGESVRFRGSFPEGAEAGVFAALDVLVVPSLALESYGLAPREAMAHGLYVLASRRGALNEITTDPRCGAGFDPENPDELRQRLLALAEDRGWQSTQSPCRTLWPTFDEHAQAVEEVYEQVLAAHRRHHG